MTTIEAGITQSCGRRLGQCLDDVCHSSRACAWPDEKVQPYTNCECQEEDHGLFVCKCGCHQGIWQPDSGAVEG